MSSVKPKRRSDPLAGAMWMLVSCALIAAVATLGRYATTSGVPPLQVVFLRVVFALITMTPLLIWRGPELLRTSQIKTYVVRVAIGLSAMTTWFIALSLVPVGEVTAISFLSPLFATIFAALGLDPYREFNIPNLPNFHHVEDESEPIKGVLA